jgi:hypothetical protein
MRHVLEFSLVDSTPDLESLIAREANGAPVPDRLRRLFHQALAHFERLAAPCAIMAETSLDAFADIYRGEGLNAASTPLDVIYPRAQRLALFAATAGDAVSEEIGILFGRGEPAAGYALDVIASEAASMLADAAAQRFLKLQQSRRTVGEDARALPYSPGYCGWHVSGQRRLFEALQPGAVGITLSSSFLMRPLKSVSGVLVAGPPAVHRFKPAYDFCDDCTPHECRGRMSSVRTLAQVRP